jgi:myo-inositol-1(or 4)-monophosphatase
VNTLGKYSKFAGAGDKANVRQALQVSDDPSSTQQDENSARAAAIPKTLLKGRKST